MNIISYHNITYRIASHRRTSYVPNLMHKVCITHNSTLLSADAFVKKKMAIKFENARSLYFNNSLLYLIYKGKTQASTLAGSVPSLFVSQSRV